MQITGAAIRAIFLVGLPSFKLVDVAKAAGVTTGAVTYYFESKDDVVSAAFDECWRRICSHAPSKGQEWSSRSFQDLMPIDVDRQRDWAVWFSIASISNWNAKLKDQQALHLKELDHLLSTVASASGTHVPKGEIDALSVAILGLGQRALQGPKRWEPNRQFDVLDRCFGCR